MIVGYQGEPGAFSEEAIVKRFGAAQTRGFETFDDLLQAIEDGDVDRGCLPIHNSIAGEVDAARRALDLRPSLVVADEISHRIEQSLIGLAGADIRTLKHAYSHPVALAQCVAFFRAHPHIQPIQADDTAASVRRIVERGEPTNGAIGSATAAQRYGAVVLLQNVADSSENFTQFLIIARRRLPL